MITSLKYHEKISVQIGLERLSSLVQYLKLSESIYKTVHGFIDVLLRGLIRGDTVGLSVVLPCVLGDSLVD
jgi:hypothetical protein